MMEEDHCMYLKRSNSDFIILSLYSDDILLVGNNKEMIDTVKRWLSSNFEMKDIGEVSYVLGVNTVRDRAFGFILRDLHQKDVRALSHTR